jgi:hypothetical protein
MQGFVEAKMLAKKFASLYFLLEDLLSPQKHYDWGLRAIKSVLVVAGSLLRAEEGQVESNVLFRALRDFNVPKILAQVCVANDNFLPAITCCPALQCAVMLSYHASPGMSVKVSAMHTACCIGMACQCCFQCPLLLPAALLLCRTW